MRNLDKVWSVWKDLDAASEKQPRSRSDYLKQLMANGNRDKILSMLAKISSDIQTAEDNKIYTSLQASMLAIINNYAQIPDNIDSLNKYIATLKGEEQNNKTVTAEDLFNMISMARPLEIKGVDFDLSPTGMEFITADSIHKVKFVSGNAVILPMWVKTPDQLSLTDSSFHKKIAKEIKKFKGNTNQLVFLEKGQTYPNKVITKDPLLKNEALECGNAKMPVKFI